MKYTVDTIIKSISYDQDEILSNIIKLYCPKGIELDPTYSKGNFYKGIIEEPKYKFDFSPQCEGTQQSCCTNLPIEDNVISSIAFDPPFVISGNPKKIDGAKQGSRIIDKRFRCFHSWEELKDMYSKSMEEFYRILKPNGVLIFKCQDIIASAKQYLTHNYIINKAIEIGYYPKDLFILLAKNRLIGPIKKQQHARKFHCYFLVLIKQPCKVIYK